MSFAIRSAAPADFERCMELVVAAYAADPTARWLWPDLSSYRVNQALMGGGMIRAAIDLGSVDIADDGSCFASWQPPANGAKRDIPAAENLVLNTATPEKWTQLTQVFAQMSVTRPKEPHWYLPTVAVDPFYQHQGRALRLLEHGLARADAQHLAVYVDSPNPRTVPTLERYGFRFIGRNLTAGDFPGLYSLHRAAR